MKSISKLKDDARKHELREEWDKAVQIYLQVLKIGDQGEGELELPLYNRVGDLYVRLGRALDAVRYYEQAADRYADAGLYNNAIALCNKAMRYQPQQLTLLRKLGTFSAMQGFYADARRYFVEYADKQIAQGKIDDALGALTDFARIADDADARELLGRRLHERGRTAEAVTELRVAHGMRVRAGQTEQAELLKQEIRRLDPSARFDDEARTRPAGGFGADLHFDTDPLAEADVDRSAPGNVHLDEGGSEYGLVDISSYQPGEVGTPGTDMFRDQSFEGTDVVADDFFGTTGEAEDQPFDLPLLADFESEATGGDRFGPGGTVSDADIFDTALPHSVEFGLPPDAGADQLAEFDDFDAPGEELPLIEGTGYVTLDQDDLASAVPGDVDLESSATWSGGAARDRTSAGAFDEYTAGAAEPEQDVGVPGDFVDWPEDPERDRAPTMEELAASRDTPQGASDALFDMDLAEFETWEQEETAAVEEMAREAAAVTERAIREAEEAERREAEEAARRAAEEAERRAAEVRAAEAHEAAVRAAREVETRQAAARETEAREAAAREIEARAAAAARAAQVRDADAQAARERATREAEGRDVAAREAARREPWSPELQGRRPVSPAPRGPAPPPARPATPDRRDDYVDLGALFADEEKESTRFRIHEALPTGDEDQDFAELLSRFKEKVAEHLPPEDAAAHYDLGLAFKEMGLIDEAIAEFQVALRSGHMRLKVYEELGYCFLHKQQYNIAEKVLRQALQVEHRHELELLGIYYQLGRAYEAMGRIEQARDAYERVLGMDLHFQDTSERLARL